LGDIPQQQKKEWHVKWDAAPFTAEQETAFAFIDTNNPEGLKNFLEKRLGPSPSMRDSAAKYRKKVIAELKSILPPSYLAQACQEGNLTRVETLLKLDYSVDVPDKEGYYPIHRAAQADRHSAELLQLLSTTRQGVPRSGFNLAQPAEPCAYGRTALHTAALFGQVKAAVWLLANGAKVLINQQEQGRFQKNTSLHNAAFNGHSTLISLLLAHGADPTLVNREGRTPLAESLVNPAVSPVLREAVIHVFLTKEITLTAYDMPVLKEDREYEALIAPLLDKYPLLLPPADLRVSLRVGESRYILMPPLPSPDPEDKKAPVQKSDELDLDQLNLI
ncbi:MAG: ankyrin repeat domain-containing protein, partial [Gammaproteobacteria bacterium]|nr:ankyrin repeat domain-containing protein [Gammaproteobacteria bacterium]